MGKVFVNIALSLDGYLAPEGMTLENWDNPGYKNWAAKWEALMAWVFNQQHFRDNLKLGPGGETGPVNARLQQMAAQTGAHLMGKRMFEGGERGWPEEAPFHTPVYVLTHEQRAPWARPGGTTFYFVTDGLASALAQARAAAGERDIRVSGGAEVIQQCLNAGVVDELEIALAPVLFGGGRRLFENLRDPLPGFRVESALHTPLATHLRYVRS